MAEKTMSTNKKFTIALVTLGVALLLVVGAVIAVFAAGFQGVNSGFKVTYSATNIEATVSAQYQKYDNKGATSGEAVDFTTAGGEKTISFTTETDDETDATQYQALTTDDVALSRTIPSVTFTYKFVNDSDTNKLAVALTGTKAPVEGDNVTVTYAINGETKTADEIASFEVEDETTVSFTVSIIEVNANASYEVDLSWALTVGAEIA